ncbi:MAG: RNase J family beta-CASP ribonuclease, partial [Ruminococcus sp.]|nr:RNase J family beta-CASP ribonuclease [Ruminococcus sp.]
HVISGPDIVSRGFVYVRESEDLLDEVRKLALGILEDCAEKNIHEWGVIKNRLREEISKLIGQRTRRSPMILPILQEV